MNSLWIVLLSTVIFAAAYRFYGTYIADKIFKADPDKKMPSFELKDDVDYVPTNKEVLFGHHFASIAGTGPIVGPAIAVIWGWVPALIWIIAGSIFAGAVHDYAAIIMSARNKGVSIGELSRKVVNNRVRMLMLFVVLFSLWIVVAIFGMVIAVIFKMYPQSVFPVWFQIPVAITVGWLAYRKNFNMTVLSLVAVVLMYVSVGIGVHFPIVMPAVFGMEGMSVWIIVLFIYAYFASVLPVWILLQPRDYINSHQLIAGLLLIVAGVICAHPVMVSPAFQPAPAGAPPIFPFLFITIACGAISGFHSLVGSGTSSKQLKNEKDIRMIGFGGMLTEGFLAVLVVVAVSAGIGIYACGSGGEALHGLKAWQFHYHSWAQSKGLTSMVTAFVDGTANMLNALFIPSVYGQAIVGVLIASFAGTTLDTATRIQRYIINEMAVNYRVRFLQRRHPATMIAVISAALLAFSQGGGRGALFLWPMFGTSNQLLAGLVLLIASVYLMRRKINAWPAFVPMIFMVVTSCWAMVVNLKTFITFGQWSLAVIDAVVLMLGIWMVLEAVSYLRKMRKER